ncbi:hypothetical protein, partial [Bacteroides acidifaciens]|uniref:hypothetical protein n=1 Tax=Bacteroides acidifaciens TaxID=85831 RepID=UPI0025B6E252
CKLAVRIILICCRESSVHMLCCTVAKGIIDIRLCIFAVAVCSQLSESIIDIASAAGIRWCI